MAESSRRTVDRVSHTQVGPSLLVLILFVGVSWSGVPTVGSSDDTPLLVGLVHDRPLPPLGTNFAGLTVTDLFPRLHAVRLEGADGGPVGRALSVLQTDPTIRYAAAEPLMTAATHIQEPRLAEQGHHKTIRSTTAWHVGTGSTQVRLAVIDSGVDVAHEEFTGRVVATYDFLDNDVIVQDDCGHGTPVAGLAAADPDNKKGGAGMVDVSLVVARVMAPDGGLCTGPLGDAAEALLWAADEGARVALVSMASNIDHPALAGAVANVTARGTLVVAAAGNTQGGRVQYPAAYPEAVAVGSVRDDKVLSTFSPAGPVDLVAPGEGLLTTGRGGTYIRVTGTSAAAPLVAGTAALMVSIAPNITTTQLFDWLKASAVDIRAKGYDDASGHGVLDAAAAIDRARDLVNSAPWLGAYPWSRVKVGRELILTANAYDRDGDTLTFNATGLPPSATVDPATGTLRWLPADAEVGIYRPQVSVSDGRAAASRTVQLEAYRNPPPVASLSGPTRVDAGTPVVYDASGSTDPDKTSLTFAWDEDTTDGAEFTAGTAKRTVMWPVPGRYTVATRVTDADGDSSVASIPVLVDDVISGEPSFSTSYGATDRIRGTLVVDWNGGDDLTRITVDVKRFHAVDHKNGPRLDPHGQTFFFGVAENGVVTVDLDPDLPAAGGSPGRNVPGAHDLVIVATLYDSLNGDTERWQTVVRYVVPASS